MSEKTTRLAVVGLGMASKPHLEALTELRGSGVEVSGIYNRSRKRSDVCAQQYGFRIFESVDEIAKDESTDGVILITPPNNRLALVNVFASAGKHILTEKPVERSTKAAKEIVSICESHEVHLGVVFQHRCRESAVKLSLLVDEGVLGDISNVRAQVPWWRPQSYYDVPGRGTYERDGGGVLISQAIHVLDFMLSLTGPADEVQSMASTTTLHDMESEDFVAGGIRFASGAVGSVVATTATYPGEIESIVIDGTKASATLIGGQLTVYYHDGRSEVTGEVSGTGGGADPMAFPCAWHKSLIEDFAQAISKNRAPKITGREALHVHRLIDALIESSRIRRAVCINE